MPTENSISSSVSRILTGRSKHDIGFLLVNCYVFLITLGQYQRLGDGTASYGLSSVVLIVITALFFREVLQLFKRERLLQLWLFLVVYISVLTFIKRPELPFLDPEYNKILALVVFCCFSAAVASLPWSAVKFTGVALAMTLGLAITGVLALVDDAGIYDLALMNVSLINDPPLVSPVAQFGHRSVMSLYLALMLSFLFVYEDQLPAQKFWLRFVLIAIGTCFLYFLIYSGNRSGVAAIAIAMFFYYAFSFMHHGRWLKTRTPGFVLSAVLAILMVFWFRNDQAMIFLISWTESPLFSTLYQAMGDAGVVRADLRFSEERRVALVASDMLRVEIAMSTFSNLSEYFFGRGFMTNTHVHFVIDIVHGAGVVGIFWLALYAYYAANMVKSVLHSGTSRSDFWLLTTPLVSWFFVGIMFNAIHLGLGWLFFGMLLARKSPLRVR